MIKILILIFILIIQNQINEIHLIKRNVLIYLIYVNIHHDVHNIIKLFLKILVYHFMKLDILIYLFHKMVIHHYKHYLIYLKNLFNF